MSASMRVSDGSILVSGQRLSSSASTSASSAMSTGVGTETLSVELGTARTNSLVGQLLQTSRDALDLFDGDLATCLDLVHDGVGRLRQEGLVRQLVVSGDELLLRCREVLFEPLLLRAEVDGARGVDVDSDGALAQAHLDGDRRGESLFGFGPAWPAPAHVGETGRPMPASESPDARAGTFWEGLSP